MERTCSIYNNLFSPVGPFSLTYERQRVIDYTVGFYEEPTSILIPPPEQESRLLACTLPFQMKVLNRSTVIHQNIFQPKNNNTKKMV